MSLGGKSRHFPEIDRVQRIALVAGLVGLGACVAAAMARPAGFYPSYLVAFLFWSGIAIGSLGIMMLHSLVGGSWGRPIRRPLEAGAMTMPVLAVLFVPLSLGLKPLYRWARPAEVAADHALKHKAIYLNENAFLLRAGGYFALWFLLSYMMSRLSSRRDREGGEGAKWWMQAISGPGLVASFLAMSFASIDWVMSLEPDWYSTIYGAMLIIGQGLETFAFMIVVAVLLSRTGEMAGEVTPGRLNDLGNLLLAFVMLWAYMAFSQFLIIWCGNLAEEIPWYIRRLRGGWQYVALALIVFHFFAPFGFLLFRDAKRQARLLTGVALGVVFMHLVDLVWLVLPARAEDLYHPYNPLGDLPILLATTVGIGGIWVAAFLHNLKSRPLVPAWSADDDHHEGGH